MKKYFLTLNTVLALITLASSLTIAFYMTGSIIGTVASKDLLSMGAVDGLTLHTSEIWRLLSSQFVHSKQIHMIMNVLFSWIAGSFIEKQLGKLKFLGIYFFGGTIGIVSSVVWYPEYVSSGSSQAMMALFASIFTLKLSGYQMNKIVLWSSVFGTIAQCGLDLYVNHGLKMGHIAGFVVGLIITFWFTRTQSVMQFVQLEPKT